MIIRSQSNAAFEKFAFMGSVLLLKAQIKSTIKFTTGIDMIRRVTIQSPTEGTFCSLIDMVLVPSIYDETFKKIKQTENAEKIRDWK